MQIRENLSNNLRYYRKKYNLSQEKFAAIIGTSLCHLSHIEAKDCDVKVSTITKYAEKLNQYDKTLNIIYIVVGHGTHIENKRNNPYNGYFENITKILNKIENKIE